MPNNCFCDQRGIGDPTQTCGDCPENYLERDNGGMMNDKNLDSGPSASLHARAEALYIAFTDNHPTIHCNRFPAWRELSNAAKREWMDKAAIAADHPTAGEKENATTPAGARDAVTDEMFERARAAYYSTAATPRGKLRAAIEAALTAKPASAGES